MVAAHQPSYCDYPMVIGLELVLTSIPHWALTLQQ
jgi:hypothetical protein